MKVIRLVWSVALLAAVGACGQKGPLYLPDRPGEIVTRPAQTPPDQEPPPTPEAPNSPQTVDSPEGQTSPAPEVVLPSPAEREADKKQDVAKPR